MPTKWGFFQREETLFLFGFTAPEKPDDRNHGEVFAYSSIIRQISKSTRKMQRYSGLFLVYLHRFILPVSKQ